MRTCFDAKRLVEMVRRVTEQARAKDAGWRPHLHCGVPNEFCELCLSHGAVGVAVSTIAESVAVAAPGHRSLLVSRPPAFSELPLISRIPQTTELILTIDHFVHAEQIAARMAGPEEEQSVVILLQSDRFGPGIRPGHDALQLARGVNELAGVRVVGLTASITEDYEAESVMKTLAHTQRTFLEFGVSAEVISIEANVDRVPSKGKLVTEIRDQTVFQTWDQAQPLVWLEAEVISRPSLQIAVVGVGQTQLQTNGDLWFPDLPVAQLLHCFPDCMAITATGDAQWLTIGDVVRVACSDFPQTSLG